MKKVMVTLDGSSLSEAALPVAQELAASSGAGLLLMTVGNLPETSLQAGEEEQELAAMLSRTAKKFAPNAEMRVDMEGDPVQGILRVADEEQADLIVMATHGRSGLSQFAHGSTASEVVHDGRKPVLLVRPKNGDM